MNVKKFYLDSICCFLKVICACSPHETGSTWCCLKICDSMKSFQKLPFLLACAFKHADWDKQHTSANTKVPLKEMG